MKNIITILLILIVPICAYLFMSRNSVDIMANAKENNLPVLMAFTSSMCMDCQKMKGILKEVEGDYTGRINFVMINALDKNRKVKDYLKKYNIVLVPTMIFLDENGNQINKIDFNQIMELYSNTKKKVEINKIEGAVTKEVLISEIEEAING